MLKYLHIENIAVIERSDIEFKEGLNVLTGETGAGKSIVIDSINAVLGERTSKDLIRTGCDRAEVSALFGDISSENLKKIAEFDIVPDEDGNISMEEEALRAEQQEMAAAVHNNGGIVHEPCDHADEAPAAEEETVPAISGQEDESSVTLPVM